MLGMKCCARQSWGWGGVDGCVLVCVWGGGVGVVCVQMSQVCLLSEFNQDVFVGWDWNGFGIIQSTFNYPVPTHNHPINLYAHTTIQSHSITIQYQYTQQVAASNELPESQHVDALFDRFLLRCAVQPLSAAGLVHLLQAQGPPGCISVNKHAERGSMNTGTQRVNRGTHQLLLLGGETDSIRDAAVHHVRLSQDSVTIMVKLRTYLMEQHEPPVFVSERRMVKASRLLKVCGCLCGFDVFMQGRGHTKPHHSTAHINPTPANFLCFLFFRCPQVAAYVDGYTEVTWLHLLLLQYMLWQEPAQQWIIREWLLAELAQEHAGVHAETHQVQGRRGAVALCVSCVCCVCVLHVCTCVYNVCVIFAWEYNVMLLYYTHTQAAARTLPILHSSTLPPHQNYLILHAPAYLTAVLSTLCVVALHCSCNA